MERNDLKRMQVLDSLESLHRQADAELTVRQVMTADVSCVSPDTSVVDLVRMFHAKAFRHLLVTAKAGQLVGVISDRDALRVLGSGTASPDAVARIKAGDIMSTDLVTISSATPLVRAIDILLDHGISCLPVVDEKRLVGILTNTDLQVVLRTLLQTLRLAATDNSLTTDRDASTIATGTATTTA